MAIFQRLRLFGAALIGNWFSAMSGGLSVPLAIVAYFVTAETSKIVLMTTAVICLVSALFKVWDTESRRSTDLQQNLFVLESDVPRIELLFEENDPRFFKDVPSLYPDGNPSARRWKIAVRNASTRKSADLLTVRAKECWFVSCTIAEAHRPINRKIEREPIILSLPTLEPQAIEYVEMFGMDWKPSNTPGEVLKRSHDFVVEARARDAITVSLTLRYEPTEPPTIKRI